VPFQLSLESFTSDRLRTISKSRYLAGIQCLKRLYLLVHEPELAAQANGAGEAIIEQGREVGLLAASCFGRCSGQWRDHLNRRSAPTREPLSRTIQRRLFDLLPVIRNHICRPAFAGTYSLKMLPLHFSARYIRKTTVRNGGGRAPLRTVGSYKKRLAPLLRTGYARA